MKKSKRIRRVKVPEKLSDILESAVSIHFAMNDAGDTVSAHRTYNGKGEWHTFDWRDEPNHTMDLTREEAIRIAWMKAKKSRARKRKSP